MISLFYIFIGGAFGAISRYFLSNILFSGPKGILICNLLGCFVIGIIFTIMNSKFYLSKDVINFITIGFLGSFTTFSTFSLNIYQLYLDKQFLYLAIYSTCSILGGLLFLLIGIFISNLIINN